MQKKKKETAINVATSFCLCYSSLLSPLFVSCRVVLFPFNVNEGRWAIGRWTMGRWWGDIFSGVKEEKKKKREFFAYSLCCLFEQSEAKEKSKQTLSLPLSNFWFRRHFPFFFFFNHFTHSTHTYIHTLDLIVSL